MGHFNVIQFRKETAKARMNLVNFARYSALTKFVAAKDELLDSFEKDKVTIELRGEIGASNISETLGGRPNLFGFIGFQAGTNPVESVKRILVEKTRLSETAIIQDFKTLVKYDFEVFVPEIDELAAATPYPDNWTVGSWLLDIENGIPGLTRYIYWRLGSAKSRSGLGLQWKHWDLRQDEFQPRPYLTDMLNKFLSRFKRKNL